MIQGYFSNPTANKESFTKDGWFKTGDILYCDRETKLWYIIDRKKVSCLHLSDCWKFVSKEDELRLVMKTGIHQSPRLPSSTTRTRRSPSSTPGYQRLRRDWDSPFQAF